MDVSTEKFPPVPATPAYAEIVGNPRKPEGLQALETRDHQPLRSLRFTNFAACGQF